MTPALGEDLPRPSLASAVAKEFGISRLDSPSELMSHAHHRSCLPRLSTLFSALAPEAFCLSKKEGGKLPLRNLSSPWGDS